MLFKKNGNQILLNTYKLVGYYFDKSIFVILREVVDDGIADVDH